MTTPVSGPDSNQPVTQVQTTKTGNTKSVRTTVDVTEHTSAYKATDAKLTLAKEKVEALRATDKAKYEKLMKVYKNSTIEISDKGNVTFHISGEINPYDFIVAYGIADGGLLDQLDERHKDDMERDKAHAVPQGHASADQTLLWYNAAEPGATIEFTDGMKYTKARGWLSGEIFNKRDCTNMKLRAGDTYSFNPSWITNNRDLDK